MITLNTLCSMKTDGDKITMLTCYEASFAALMNRAGVEILLIGDSLAMTVQGQSSTLPVSLDHMVYHTQNVARATAPASSSPTCPSAATSKAKNKPSPQPPPSWQQARTW